MFQRVNLPFRIAESFFRSWKIFALVFTLVVAVVAVALARRNATYLADANVRVTQDELEISMADPRNQRREWMTPAQKSAGQFNDMMRDLLPGGFVDSVLKKAQLRKPINIDPKAKDERLIKLIKGTYTSPLSNEVFAIGLTWDDPDECSRLVQAMQDQYISEMGVIKQIADVRVSNFLTNQIGDVRRRMQNAEMAVTRYKQEHRGVGLDNAQEALFDRLTGLYNRKSELESTLQESGIRAGAMASRLKGIAQVTKEVTKRADRDPLIDRIEDLKSQLAVMAGTTGVLKSDKEVIERQIREMQKRLKEREAKQLKLGGDEVKSIYNPRYEELQYVLAGMAADSQARRAQLEETKKQIVTLEAEIDALPKSQRALQEKLRDYEVLKTKLEDLMKRREQALTRADMTKITAESAFEPLKMVAAESTMDTKRKIMVIGIALVLGLIMAGATILLREWMDPSFRYADDIERMLGVPVLIALPERAKLIKSLTAKSDS